jgi:tetratricopeptide (TPR) repeat protein
VERAAARQGCTALVAGEAGIGKSRLLAELWAHLHAHEWRQTHPDVLTLQGRCFEPDRAYPYAPLLDLFRTFFAACSPETLAGQLGSAAPEFIKLLPELADVLPDLVASPMLEPAQEQRRLNEALTQFFLRLAAHQPLLVIVEDVHWSDDSSLETLLNLARRIGSHPCCLVLSYRSGEVQPSLAALLAALDRERLASDLVLLPLGRHEVDAMLRAIFGLQRPVRADFLEALHALTEGNPFFIEEVLKSLMAAGEIFYAGGAWDRLPVHALHIPRTVQVAVRRRLEQLSPEARQVLSLAAVAGRRFDFGLLQALTQHDEADLLALIKESIVAQLVVEESADTFAFRHALTQQAVSAGLLARERRALHKAIGDTIERCYADTLETHLADLAGHFAAGADWPKALDYAQRAGQRALSLYAPRAAAEQFTRAVEAAQASGVAPSFALYQARGRANEWSGTFDAAHEDYTRLLAMARESRDLRTEWQALLDLGSLWRARDYDLAGGFFAQALERARAIGAPATLAISLNLVGNRLLNADQPLDARRHHQEALEIFERVQDARGIAATLDFLGVASYFAGDLLAGAAYYEQAVVRYRDLDDRHGLASCLVMLATRGTNYLHLPLVWPETDAAGVLREGQEALKIAGEIGWRSGEAFALVYLGMVLGPRGEYASAIAYARKGLEVATEVEHRQWRIAAHVALGALELDLLALPTARENLEQAVDLAKEMHSHFSQRVTAACLARVYIAQRDLALAGAALDGALARDAPTQTQAERLVWSARAELALARGDAESALAIVDRLIASALRVERIGDGAIPFLWHLRGEALLALGRPAQAEEALRAAQRVATLQGGRPQLWRTLTTLGKAYRAQGRHRDAEEVFASAHRIVDELAKSIPDTALRDTFLQGARDAMPRVPPPSPRRLAKQAYGGLTEREREVAAMVAVGRSNRAIAEMLVVSERTVAKHVENILGKLAFSSRAQIAAWAVAKNLSTRTARPNG